MSRNLGSVLTAMVTPFDRHLAVDYARAAALARHLAASGSDGLVVGGTTGESPTLSEAEKLKLFETVLAAAGDRVTVVAGTGSNSTAHSIELTRQAATLGVHAIMLVGPYYNKPPQEGLFRHFQAVAEATDLPVIVYNVPGRTSANILPETIARLTRIPNIVAVKEASGSVDQASAIIRAAGPGLRVYSGDDSLTLPILAVGGAGVVSVAAHVAGRQIKAMVSAYLAGDTALAAARHRELFPLFKAMFLTTNPIPVKTALRLTGMDVGGLRLPLVGATPAEEAAIAAVLGDLGLLTAPERDPVPASV